MLESKARGSVVGLESIEHLSSLLIVDFRSGLPASGLAFQPSVSVSYGARTFGTLVSEIDRAL